MRIDDGIRRGLNNARWLGDLTRGYSITRPSDGRVTYSGEEQVIIKPRENS
jgi:hypothetical protein